MAGHEEGMKEAPRTIPVQQDFLFVDAAQAKTSRQGRKNARSFVMQKARRERPWSTSKHAAKRATSGSTSRSPRSAGTRASSLTPSSTIPSPSLTSVQADYFASQEHTLMRAIVCPECQIFLCRPGQGMCPRCLFLKPMSALEGVDNSLFDPFGTSSVETNASVSELLEHFASEMAPSVIAVDFRRRSTLMRSQWFGTAVNDTGFMHSLLCTAALHLYMVGRGSIETILYHRAKAISAINAAISNLNDNTGLSDANIGAVFNLLTIEESLQVPVFTQERLDEEQPNQRAIHESGLKKMVQLRGGLMAMSSNRILQAFMLWHSTAWAVAEFRAPDPSALEYIKTGNFPRHPPGYQSSISQHLLDSCRYAGVKETLTSLVEGVLILIADLNVWFNDASSTLDPLDIQNYSCVLECRALDWLHENEHLITPLEDALCVALLIFTVRTTEALQRKADIHLLHFAASKRLEQALNCTIRHDWQHCPDLLLWILSIGAISANGSAESNWFVYQTSLACLELGIVSAEALLARLDLCGWVSYKLNAAVHDLWDRIIQLRLEPQFDPPTKIEDANSPVGPLQRHVAEPYLEEWKHVDWPSFNLGEESSGVYEHGYSGHGESGAMDYSGAYNDALFRVADEDETNVRPEYYSA
ncbi:hypothetical protein HBI56_127480 [Parastagonospora nodorum]|uniref:Transcription factor domain-containing protein n=2 Tax=Phaeosphaeria nodorum (strain SN15 / ATCC MYA-4574 / FGSC 10173) TaxID=321614 RepID=A0A7U2F4T0_PHANO|nr:hypothetical protein SNOG_04764 [Parastagonospora nodorum SN15]KAH3909151.1 hypothetical protein HBH56_168850 [Parastagonospora nodorum]EAT88524.1 hypothetical protein SNOG_04764 [Parastagonospora nodorum SN15]KAH3936244.1 hypothetical protein HBH54_031940 [Parastagonospora nodorum]KAH3948160.1 hypothetical protein HBH53_106710 [Parastagonospora nodorum]KAH3968752.1 hypothetical protein HBH51_130620 [Parastagonospora nodorum]